MRFAKINALPPNRYNTGVRGDRQETGKHEMVNPSRRMEMLQVFRAKKSSRSKEYNASALSS
jgi:hypothetical protein